MVNLRSTIKKKNRKKEKTWITNLCWRQKVDGRNPCCLCWIFQVRIKRKEPVKPPYTYPMLRYKKYQVEDQTYEK